MSLINYRMIGFCIVSFIVTGLLNNRAARVDGDAFSTFEFAVTYLLGLTVCWLSVIATNTNEKK